MKWNWLLWTKYDPEDFSAYLPQGPESVKEKLIAECQRRGISVYINDASETSSGAYAALRAVAPEAELHSRLQQAITVGTARGANRIAWLALFVGLAGLIVAVFK